MKLLLTLLTLSLPAFSATTVGPSGEGITSGTRSAFLTALGGTTAGKALFQMANPGAVRYLRLNADNTVSQLDAASFLSGIGGGSGSGSFSGLTGQPTDNANLSTALSGKVATTTLSPTGGANKVAQYDSNGDLDLGATSSALVSISSQNNIVPSLDTAGSAAVAFGLQRLRSAYFGPCIKVRRATDSAETDIGFAVDGSLNTAALLEFCCGGSAFIKTWYDQSGNARDLTQATTTKQFTIVASGVVSTLNGQPAALVTAASSQNMVTASFSLSGSSAATLFAGFASGIVSGGNVLFDHGNPAGGSGGVGINANQNPAAKVQLVSGLSGSIYQWNNFPTSFVANQPLAISGVIDPSKSTQSSRLRVRLNGSDGAETSSFASGTLTTACFVSDVLTVGSNIGGAGLWDGKVSTMIIFPSALTAENMGAVENQVMRSVGLGTPFVAMPSTFDDTGAASFDLLGFYRASSNSTVTYSTRATTLKINAYTDLYSNNATWAKIGVWVNGAYFTDAATTADGFNTSTIYLPAGLKTVTLINGLQSQSGGGTNPVLGSWFISAAANAPLSRVNLSSANRLLVYGDSIISGDAASPVFQNSWVMRLRAIAPYPVAVEAWGWRSLWSDCSDSTARAAFVAKVVAWNPTKMWIEHGSNDYGLYPWSAASFGTAYAALLTDLHTALPSLQIYAQTPVVRGNESNTNTTWSNTLAQYRSQIVTATSGKSYVTLVDGTAFLTLTDFQEAAPGQLHPTTNGHLLIFNAVKSVLGL